MACVWFVFDFLFSISDNWDDDAPDQEFMKQLRAELSKKAPGAGADGAAGS